MTDVFDAIKAIGSGFATTFRHLFRRPITEGYPEYKRPLPERSRARIILTRDPDGGERCVACYLCSAVCPVSCISMQSAEKSDGRRYARWFRINFGRCIYCGLCEEACPTSAIQLTPDFENCRQDILTLVYEKEDLLVDHCGKDPAYNFYRHAGIVTREAAKGEHIGEDPPVNIKSNLP
ncbi:NADH-quinone oxidoreductase subunit NuoI [Desulfococcus multivorans]|uniref:NADH-quinone oxidoreductase subunit I n=1 Tax=Desulfococcus multivorans DSM 2059 TaxID=1121405 RepID=S7TXQ0_DESML|nr:NADH-quinone oxidoreductase subunit NuoI [Desulfococcus multivorans]AOY58595.1 NuoI: NADH quinone oxidoreductase, subunit I [Desulfococcus multivorans]AQV00899.1 NADH-quinone oxidoreductase subunit I [Desulfococcus multivorans]EPR41555.1 NAD(P)H-quinone oxidoreductase subunit I [Desulfococcus multivorans DSM 2059]SJZ44244.1 NADH dehydrogenase subunit I [Desulfococcus multivorans DSM 2059]